VRSRLRQRAIVSLLKTSDSPPKILASQLFFLFDVNPSIDNITDNMTLENVLVAVGKILHSKQRLNEDVGEWARDLFKQAGLSFTIGNMDHEENSDPPSALSVVTSQPANPKPAVQPKRKTRRIYLNVAIQCLEKGSCTHKGLVDAIMKQYPNLNRETVSTFVSDVQNPKYSPIKDRKVVKQADGTLIFKDKIKPMLTVIENPNFAGTEETGPVTNSGRKASSSRGDL
jgi:hypothetical protein